MAIASAIVIAVLFLLSMQLLHFKIVLATTFTVGDDAGWNHNVTSWPNGKNFRAGDILLFRYDPAQFNVVAVDETGYYTCNVPPRAKVYQTGNDEIPLRKGPSFFMSSFPGHCAGGVKIAVAAN